MMTSHVSLWLLAVLMVFALGQADIAKREVEDSEMNEPKRKRPFCNAFTGCGRKRSDDSLSSLPDVGGSEPAVAELSRQILSEAKMWEAIQEARAELQMRRRQHQLQNPAALLERGDLQMTSYRKRRSIAKPQQGPR